VSKDYDFARVLMGFACVLMGNIVRNQDRSGPVQDRSFQSLSVQSLAVWVRFFSGLFPVLRPDFQALDQMQESKKE
jgi:hypothetical protein